MNTLRVLVRYVESREAQDWLRARTPKCVELTFASHNEPPALQIRGHEVLYGLLDQGAFPQADSLKWVQSHATGVESFLYPDFVAGPIILTNIKGVLAQPMAEHAIGMLLYLTRRLAVVHEQTKAGVWKTVSGFEIAGQTIAIVGLGNVGREIARRAKPMDVSIIAVDPGPEEVPTEIESVYEPRDLAEVVSRARITISCVPAVAETYRMFDATVFSAMPTGAWFLNLSRGSVVDEAALVDALTSDHLSGAAVDVTEVEPYPSDGPLWRAPNILISSHSSAYSQRLDERKLGFFAENLQRYVDGAPLLNVVDKERGY